MNNLALGREGPTRLMPDTSEKLFGRMKAAAIELFRQNPTGALQIFVGEGNCAEEHLEFCLSQAHITQAEREFCQRMLSDFSDKERYGIWALSQCADIRTRSRIENRLNGRGQPLSMRTLVGAIPTAEAILGRTTTESCT